MSIEVEVSGIGDDGRPFRECARTIEVSDWGCSFYFSFGLEKDAIIALSVVGKQPYCLREVQPVMFQVNYAKQAAGAWIVGASKLQVDRLWDIEAMSMLPRS
ncbi:MAG TPA: hypothetical protein VGI46_20735 [Candidatus Acidoferrum sp.]